MFKLGKDIYFYSDTTNEQFMKNVENLYGVCPTDLTFPKSHMTPIYLAGLLDLQPAQEAKQVLSRLISVHCPVDVEVRDSDGTVVGYTENGVAYNTNISAVRIVVVEDEKFIELPGEGEFTIKYTGTDSGTMAVEDQIYNSETGELVSEKKYENIELAEGKTFSSLVDCAEETAETKIYVTDQNDKIEAEVQPDGSEKVVTPETEKPVTPPATKPAVKPQKKAAAERITISKAPSISKPKAAAKGKVTFTWKKFKQTKKTKTIWKKIKKVEVQYSTDKAFKKGVTSKLVGKSKTKLVVKKFAKKTTYYVRIRYTDGAGGYSKWSKVKKVKTKK